MSLPTEGKIWMDGDLVEWQEAKVHVLTHALHYGSGVFEGIRAYPTPDGPAVFRLRDHIERLFRSAKIAMLPMPFSVDQLIDAVKTVVRVNGHDSCYIRPLVYRGYGEMGLNPLPVPVNVSIAAWPWGAYLGDDNMEAGITAAVSSWRRHDPNTMPAAAKATANYVNSSLAKVEAMNAGYDEAIMLNQDGYVTEGSAENIFIVKDGVLITPPLSSGALSGIRRASVMEIARDLGITVEEHNLIRTDLYTADEVFCTGTAAEVAPIRSVDEREIEKPWPVTTQLQQAMQDATHGRTPKYEKWVDKVG